jgi:hypothetical protein
MCNRTGQTHVDARMTANQAITSLILWKAVAEPALIWIPVLPAMSRSRETAHLVRGQLHDLPIASDVEGQPQAGVLGNDLVYGFSKCDFGALF